MREASGVEKRGMLDAVVNEPSGDRVKIWAEICGASSGDDDLFST